MSASAEGGRPAIGGATRTVGVIGWPVDHSLSPAIHNAAFTALGMDWVYVPLPVPPGRVADALRGLPALGFAGANVTMPHKTAVADEVDVLTDDARLLHAVNTVQVTPDGLVGHNTDAPGFARFLRDDAGVEAAGTRALVLGSGGAARACTLALARAGVERLVVAARDLAAAQQLAPLVRGTDALFEAVELAAAADQDVDLVVNATPLGAAAEVPPHPAPRPGMIVIDLLYRPPVTVWQQLARQAGAEAHGGLGLLLHQAALSFELWSGRVPPLEAMSAAAVGRLADELEGRGA